MKLCLFGLFGPLFVRWRKKKIKKETETDNYYTCVALRAAGKNLYMAVLVKRCFVQMSLLNAWYNSWGINNQLPEHLKKASPSDIIDRYI